MIQKVSIAYVDPNDYKKISTWLREHVGYGLWFGKTAFADPAVQWSLEPAEACVYFKEDFGALYFSLRWL